MSEFSDLPNEILIKILEYCQVLQLTLVSKRFNEVISGSAVLMSKLHLVIPAKSPNSEILQSKRKYQNIAIKFNYKIDEDALEAIKKVGENVKQLELIRCVVSQKDFNTILKSLPHLEVFSSVSTFIKESEAEHDLEVPQTIKKVNIRNFSPNFFGILQKMPGLKSVVLLYPSAYDHLLIDFFTTHPNIEEIDNLTFGEIDEAKLSIILNMKKLKKLSMNLEKVSLEAVRNVDVVNESINSLSLVGNSNPPQVFSHLIALFKGLKKLEVELSALTPYDMHFNSIPIESLTFTHCLVDHHRFLHLPSLKHLSLHDASNFTNEDWNHLATLNPNIEMLVVKDESICNEKFTTITQSMLKLRHFELFFDPQRLTSDILNFIAGDRFPLNIKILKICERNPSSERIFQLTSFQKEMLNLRHGFQLYLG